MTNRDWLAGLKAGDRVATARHGGCGYALFRVTRVTPTQIVVGGQRYNRKTGAQVGAGGWGRSLIEPTEEIRAGCRRDALLSKLAQFDYRALPTATLEELYAIVRRSETQSSEGEEGA
jgi:hypothetical protein